MAYIQRGQYVLCCQQPWIWLRWRQQLVQMLLESTCKAIRK